MVAGTNRSFLHSVEAYYSQTLAQHGATAKGVDWNGPESQHLRFQQLSKILALNVPFSINDIGCGYGALYDYLRRDYADFQYCGVDISSAMIEAARARHDGDPKVVFHHSTEAPHVCDYSVASGIFSVCLETPHEQWRQYIKKVISHLNASSDKGFAFNCLTSYSDTDKMKPHLYYADPCELFDFCKRNFSQHVALLHDYGLYEFTILVRKPT